MTGDLEKRPEDEQKIYTAAVVLIGNEILSGRIQDRNLAFLAGRLKDCGIRLLESRVIPDVLETIVDTVNHLRCQHDHIFTTGGIGPTHDDITAEAIARAFGVPLQRHPEAERILREYYGDEINDARLRMANVPLGGELLDNPVSRAPGFRMENVYVLPGVPRIMQSMFDGFRHSLSGGQPVLSRTLTVYLAESIVAPGLATIQDHYPDAEIGSYPYIRQGRFGAALVVRTTDPKILDAASEEIAALTRDLGADPIVTDGETTP